MASLIINLDEDVRETLVRFCSVPDDYALLSYQSCYGLLWMAVRADDRVPVTFQMRPSSFTVNMVQQNPLPMITMRFTAEYFQIMVRLVPNNHVLLCNIDPSRPHYELVFVNQQDGTRFCSLVCSVTAIDDIVTVAAMYVIHTLYSPTTNYRIFVPRHVMRNFVLHSQEIQASIAVISWGHLVMICCGAERVLLVQDNAVGFNGPYRRFRLSLHNPHVVDYPFDIVHWYFSYVRGTPVATIRLNNSMRIFLNVTRNSFVEPEVLP